MIKSKPDEDYNLVLPENFPDYIKNVEELIKYADKVTHEPLGEESSKRLEEIATLNCELFDSLDDIKRYLESNHWKYVITLMNLEKCLKGRIYMLNGCVPEAH
jgi:hypothetical protein